MFFPFPAKDTRLFVCCNQRSKAKSSSARRLRFSIWAFHLQLSVGVSLLGTSMKSERFTFLVHMCTLVSFLKSTRRNSDRISTPGQQSPGVSTVVYPCINWKELDILQFWILVTVE